VLYLVPRRTTGTPPAPAKPPARYPAPPPEKAEPVDLWVWPAAGKWNVVSHSSTGSQGLLISGTEGDVVKAAARGKVVYTGSGLRGFGNLVIIKHTNVFLSAYGHNRAVNVKEGDEVAAGQPIAEMGLTPDRKPALYFEIRYNGQPVDPILYLPRR
jgi:lipoprotein NlpD